MACFSEAQRYYEKHGDSANIAQICRNIGNLFFGQGLYQKANTDYLRAASINMRLGNILEAGTDYSNLAVACMMMGSDSAQKYFRAPLKTTFFDASFDTNIYYGFLKI